MYLLDYFFVISSCVNFGNKLMKALKYGDKVVLIIFVPEILSQQIGNTFLVPNQCSGNSVPKHLERVPSLIGMYGIVYPLCSMFAPNGIPHSTFSSLVLNVPGTWLLSSKLDVIIHGVAGCGSSFSAVAALPLPARLLVLAADGAPYACPALTSEPQTQPPASGKPRHLHPLSSISLRSNTSSWACLDLMKRTWIAGW